MDENQLPPVPALLVCVALVVQGVLAGTNWRGYFRRLMRAWVPEEAPVRWLPWWRNYDPEREADFMTKWFRVTLSFFGLAGAYGVVVTMGRLIG